MYCYGVLVHAQLGYIGRNGGTTFDPNEILYMTEEEARGYCMGKVVRLR